MNEKQMSSPRGPKCRGYATAEHRVADNSLQTRIHTHTHTTRRGVTVLEIGTPTHVFPTCARTDPDTHNPPVATVRNNH